jgi:Membrane bound O-acyl transferase family
MSYLAACFASPAVYLCLALLVKDGRFRASLGPLSVFAFLVWLAQEAHHLGPVERLLCCSLWLLYVIKGWSLLNQSREDIKSFSPLGLLLFSYIWPGIDATPFRERQATDPTAARWFVFGFPTMCLGVAAILLLALHTDSLSPTVLGLAGIAGVLTTVHLGYSDVLSSAMRLIGFPVSRLFDQPLLSRSLRDFWSHRWNGPFVEMNKLLFRPLLRNRFSRIQTALALFLISGLLHELALSFPAQGGWGGPLFYFLIQGTAVRYEKRIAPKSLFARRLFIWAVLLLPAPLLFHTAFREALILPLLHSLHSLPALSSVPDFWVFLLTAAGYGHFLVLVASFQVPHRLNWREELQRLRPLNRKLLWTYGAYIASMILIWGLVTLNLRAEFLQGDKTSLVLLGIIALFWWSRVIIDAFYFEHSDWPEGLEFILGHTMLTSLFVTLASTYTGLLLWHVIAE